MSVGGRSVRRPIRLHDLHSSPCSLRAVTEEISVSRSRAYLGMSTSITASNYSNNKSSTSRIVEDSVSHDPSKVATSRENALGHDGVETKIERIHDGRSSLDPGRYWSQRDTEVRQILRENHEQSKNGRPATVSSSEAKGSQVSTAGDIAARHASSHSVVWSDNVNTTVRPVAGRDSLDRNVSVATVGGAIGGVTIRVGQGALQGLLRGGLWGAAVNAFVVGITSGRVMYETSIQRDVTRNGTPEPTDRLPQDDSPYDPLVDTTIRTTQYGDGSFERSEFDSLTGDQTTTFTDSTGSTTRTASSNDVPAANSPRTNVTTSPDGAVSTTITTPTGLTIAVPSGSTPTAPAPASARAERESTGSDGSQSNGPGSDFSSDFSASDGDPNANYSSTF